MSHRRPPVFGRAFGCAILCLLGLALAGCQTPEQQAAQQAVASYFAGDYATSKKLLQPLAKNTNEDFVLNNVRLGSTLLIQYDLNESQAAFLRAYEVINSLGVNNGGRSLGAALVDEKIKIWKGEPFERAMANFYLGLTYYMQADYANARGAFENALFKLRDYSTSANTQDVQADKYRDVESTFVLAQYMLARCFQRLGKDDLAHANFARVQSLRPELAMLANESFNQQSNVLLVIDYGTGPHKETNMDGALAGFAPTPAQVGAVPHPTIQIDDSVADTLNTACPLVDLISLAQDRKWQDIDTIRAVKSVVGTGMLAAGAYELGGRHQSDTEVGLALVATGLLLKATSQADVRIWEMLPRATFAVPLSIPPGIHDITVQFPGSGTMRQTLHHLIIPARGEATYYIRLQHYSNDQITWPPPTLTGWPEPSDVPTTAPSAPVAAAH